MGFMTIDFAKPVDKALPFFESILTYLPNATKTWKQIEPHEQFDIAEAYQCIAHDWGEYQVATYLDKIMQLTFRPNLKYDTLSELGKLIYNELDSQFGNFYIVKDMEQR